MTDTSNSNTDNAYSVKSLVAWIEYAGNKGLINKSTAIAKKAAVTEVLVHSDILQDIETNDVRNLNPDDVFDRYVRRYSTKYPPETLKTYRSRVKSSVATFLKYKENPEGFSSKTPKIKTAQKTNTPKPSSKSNMETQGALTVVPKDEPADGVKTFDLPVPIRDGDHMVIISNIPKDIQEEDIKRISAVIRAYSNE